MYVSIVMIIIIIIIKSTPHSSIWEAELDPFYGKCQGNQTFQDQ
jgi:hypothetical protein